MIYTTFPTIVLEVLKIAYFGLHTNLFSGIRFGLGALSTNLEKYLGYNRMLSEFFQTENPSVMKKCLQGTWAAEFALSCSILQGRPPILG